MFVMPCAIVTLLSLYLSFLHFGLMVRTRSRPYGLCHCPYTEAHIKGFGSFPFCMSMLACFYSLSSVLASLVLGFATFDVLSGFVVVWLHLTPMRLCSGVTNWDASLSAKLLCAPSLFLLRAMLCLPCLFVPLANFICIFTRLLICPCMSLAC